MGSLPFEAYFRPAWLKSNDPYGGLGLGSSDQNSTGSDPFSIPLAFDGYDYEPGESDPPPNPLDPIMDALSVPLTFDGFSHESSPMPELPNNGATVPDDTTTPGASNNAATLPDNGGLYADTQDQLSGLPDLSDIGDFFSGLLASTGDLQQDAARFNAEQAQLNRQWQEHMSNTAYQRAVADLRKAGLNPILALGSHDAATTPAGSSASVNTVSGDTIGTLLAALGSLASSIADFLPNVNFSKIFSESVSKSTSHNYNFNKLVR